MGIYRADLNLESRGELFYFSEKKVFKKHADDLQEEKIFERFILVLSDCRTLIQWKRLLSLCRNKKCGVGSVPEAPDLPL